jgi:hypothetical protein
MQSHFIKSCAALGVVGLAGSAFAGDTVRFDVSFSDINLFFIDFAAGELPANEQIVVTGDPGRYVQSVGFSNVDVNVCWNTGSSFTGWASEVVFDINLDDGDVDGDGEDTAWYFIAPFAGDDTGADAEGTCSNRQALPETDVPLAPFTFKVAASGDVATGMSSAWNEGLGLRHSEVNTADFYFLLGGEIPAGCDGATGGCAEEHPTPGCDDITCCSLTCEVEPFCCDIEWDSSCVSIAVDVCGIYQYECVAPAYANDCATSPTMMSNGQVLAFNTVGANTDGPDAPECGSGDDDLPIWGDLWYMIEVADEATVTMTCCNLADFDTKIAMYSAGAIGDPIDPSTLPDDIIGCNEDCDDPDFFSSELISTVPAGQYLVRVGGFLDARGTGDLVVSWEEPEPPLAAPECATPGDTNISQITVDSAEFGNGGVWCGAAAENVIARSYPAADLGGAFDVSCVDFAWFFNEIDSYMPTIINLYVTDAANPLDQTVQNLVATTSCGLYSGPEGAPYTISSQSFDAPINIEITDGEFLMVEVRIQRQLAGGVEYGGFCGFLLSDSTAEGYISCGGDYFGSLSDIGFPDLQPYIVLNGSPAGGSQCEGDFNDDGIVNGADFGSILAAWGPCADCPEDLNEDGQVSGADVGLLLSLWGNCPG